MKVTVYSTTTCPFCKMEKAYLDSKNIQYTNIFVDQDSKTAEQMLKISGQMGVPFTVIEKDDGTKVTILGFEKAKLNVELGIS